MEKSLCSLMKQYTYIDNVFLFEGCISLRQNDDWIQPVRINDDKKILYPYISEFQAPHWKSIVSEQCSGVRLCFATDSENIIMELAEVFEGMQIDLYVNEQYKDSVVLSENETEVKFTNIDSGFNKITIWLDQRFSFKLKSIWLDKGARINKTLNYSKIWVHYGSSISHSREAGSPSNTWTSLVSRKLQLNLTNLGYAANCALEPMVGRMIRDLPADFITMKLGINVHAGHLSRRTFLPNAIGLVSLIREKHPSTPIVIISPIYSSPREDIRKWEFGLTLGDMRKILEEVVERFRQQGDKNIYYVDGLNIFGQKEAEYLPDQLHPNAQGQFALADNFIREVFQNLKLIV